MCTRRWAASRCCDIVANFQPLLACADAQMLELTMPFLGEERSPQQYPIASLMTRGVTVAFGSDWPVSSPDPLAEMHVEVTRQAPPGARFGSDPARRERRRSCRTSGSSSRLRCEHSLAARRSSTTWKPAPVRSRSASSPISP